MAVWPTTMGGSYPGKPQPPANPEPETEAAQSRKRSARGAANTTLPES